ncbi:Rrp15p-domain-containing protein [Metschnikowia bicuspidata var. bicuspidata NRRL YB-4993]|uniref:Rrp15p-domain-containing protein n=1 Tax=Metschnikowia bicuspidata var. bicuspidata NRRL YB-4993 TaxID=869754 RepID=A0A1A0HJ11_9ASCO|nr:Rrp15p-domain-containing protein [Metschnikowia bicuspidata var. bicuspidata NRRL YB-4993]OBA23872.1 Rrp15p-domain-containing protein [Metschnikowia bicuspidata var. bicuspidata NRRL YB-4993]
MAQKRSRENAGKSDSTAKVDKKAIETSKILEENENLSDLSDSGLDDDDEFAAGQEGPLGSSSLEEDGEGSADESEDESFPLKKKKKNTDDGRGTFANAFNAILGSKLKAHDRKDPIMVRSKGTLKKLESDKLEAKAKRLMHSEKKELQDKLRVTNLLPSASDTENVREIIEKERRLKKVAQKGVVKLFNAVLATQVRTTHDVGQEKVGMAKKEELINELTKLKFLDLVKAAGEE